MATQQRSALEDALKGMGSTANNLYQGVNKNLGALLQGAQNAIKNNYQRSDYGVVPNPPPHNRSIIDKLSQQYNDFSKNTSRNNVMSNISAQNLKNNFKSALNKVVSTSSNFVKDLPYNVAQVGLNYQKMGKTPVKFSTADARDLRDEKIMNKEFSNPITQNEGFYSEFGGSPDFVQKQAGNSAELRPYVQHPYYYVPDKNNYLESLKQGVLVDGGFTPRAKEYLSQVPIIYEAPPSPRRGYAGVSRAEGTPEQYIALNPKISKYAKTYATHNKPGPILPKQEKQLTEQYINSVIEHELLHQTPELLPRSLYTPKNKEKINGYINLWGEEYMERPGALVGEMFAEKDLPPAYYWHVFSEINPKLTPQDFINELKNYFTINGLTK